jgi:hypothetical protein
LNKTGRERERERERVDARERGREVERDGEHLQIPRCGLLL